MTNRPLIPVLISFILGLLTASYYSISEKTIFSMLMAVLLLAVLLTLKRIKPTPIVYIAFFFLGLLFMLQEINPVLPSSHIKNIIEHKHTLNGFAAEREKLNILGRVYLPPERFTDRTRLYIEAERLYKANQSFQISGKILLTVGSPTVNLRYGDKIRFQANISKPRNFGNYGEYDYKWHMERKGIYAKGSVENERWVVKVSENGQTNWLTAGIEEFRKKINALIDKVNSKHKGIMKALLIGERSEIQKEVREAFVKTGTAHILAISGLHIGIVAFVIYTLCYRIFIQAERLTLRFDIRKLAGLASIPPVLFYGLLAGMSVSTQRAVIMVIVFILAIAINRGKDLLNTLAFAAFIILIISPSSVYDISFQLSFASVSAIIYLMPKLQFIANAGQDISPAAAEPTALYRIFAWLKDKILTGFLVSIAAVVGTAPISAYHFHRVSVIGIFANIVVVPLIGFVVVILELSAGLISIFSDTFAVLIFQAASLFLEITIWVIDVFSRLPYSYIWVSTPTILETILFYLFAVSIVSIKSTRISRYAVLVLAAVIISDYAYWYHHTYYNKNLKVTFISVGQGDSALIEFPMGKRMLIDGGGFIRTEFDTGENIIAPFLWKNKIKTIDYIVMSHPQSDHFKGLKFIAENFNVKEFWWNGDHSLNSEFNELFKAVERKNIKERVIARDVLNINGVKIESLNLLIPEETLNKNNASLLLKLSFGKVSFLFTGDIEKEAEESLIREGVNIKADVLKVPHHGSKTSSTEGFLKGVNPQIAVISLGYANQFMFPHKAVIERYQNMGINLMRTDLMGAVRVETDGRERLVSSYW